MGPRLEERPLGAYEKLAHPKTLRTAGSMIMALAELARSRRKWPRGSIVNGSHLPSDSLQASRDPALSVARMLTLEKWKG
jgi:hypothetical protein